MGSFHPSFGSDLLVFLQLPISLARPWGVRGWRQALSRRPGQAGAAWELAAGIFKTLFVPQRVREVGKRRRLLGTEELGAEVRSVQLRTGGYWNSEFRLWHLPGLGRSLDGQGMGTPD